MSHGITNYACGHPYSRCRCPGPHEVKELKQKCPKCRAADTPPERHIDRVMRFAADRKGDVEIGFLGEGNVEVYCAWWKENQEPESHYAEGKSLESAAKALMVVLDGLGDGGK